MANKTIDTRKMAQSTSTQGRQTSPYAKQPSRITKENLYMVLALWMERFPVAELVEADHYRKVGAVLVLPSNTIYAVECTREGVHGVARLLMSHQDVLQDCKVFVSRKPCSFCTKLLVQSKVKRVFYLPIEPEYNDIKDKDDESSRVDNLFKVSEIGQSVFVPKAGQEVLNDANDRHRTPEAVKEKIKDDLMGTYWREEWMADATVSLPWPPFDNNMKTQVGNDFNGIMNWMAIILAGSEEGYKFKALSDQNKLGISFDPESHDLERRQAFHLISLAKFLAERTDEPTTGVGAVIINKQKDIVGLAWNGFPTNALYGEFPRASNKDEAEKKYPYSIHAEQNALLKRNTKNVTGGTLFVTKMPCDECTPLLTMQGIETVVLGVTKFQMEKKEGINYTKFPKKVADGGFICFRMESA